MVWEKWFLIMVLPNAEANFNNNIMRLDMYLCVNKSNAIHSRQKAQEAIKQGRVRVNNKVVYKNSMMIDSTHKVEVEDDDLLLGRAGYKLRGFLQNLESANICNADFLHNKRVLDVGSSTGGFAQVLLESQVREIVCVDVGYNQLHQKLRTDTRICLYEGCDIREFVANGTFDLCVCDVSFISLYALLPYFEALDCAEFILLFKPQFEVGKNLKRNKKGVLKDKNEGLKAFEKFCQNLKERGFDIIHNAKSELNGKEGNEEFFVYTSK